MSLITIYGIMMIKCAECVSCELKNSKHIFDFISDLFWYYRHGNGMYT